MTRHKSLIQKTTEDKILSTLQARYEELLALRSEVRSAFAGRLALTA